MKTSLRFVCHDRGIYLPAVATRRTVSILHHELGESSTQRALISTRAFNTGTHVLRTFLEGDLYILYIFLFFKAFPVLLLMARISSQQHLT